MIRLGLSGRRVDGSSFELDPRCQAMTEVTPEIGITSSREHPLKCSHQPGAMKPMLSPAEAA